MRLPRLHTNQAAKKNAERDHIVASHIIETRSVTIEVLKSFYEGRSDDWKKSKEGVECQDEINRLQEIVDGLKEL